MRTPRSDGWRVAGRRGVALLAVAAVLLAAGPPPAGAAGGTVTRKAAKVRRVLLEPAGYEKVVLLVNDGKEYKYYRFSADAPLAVEVTGPTTLEIFVRLLFDRTMKGTQDFSLRVEEEGAPGSHKEVGAHALKARKSGVSTLKEQGDVVPAKAERLGLAVPSGRHAYRVVLGGAERIAAVARVLIPKKDLAAGVPQEGGRP